MSEPIKPLALFDIERRVLGHLPVWTEDEEAFQQAELDAGALESIRSYTLHELRERLEADPATELPMDLIGVLGQLAVDGLAVVEDDGDSAEEGRWRMTKEGFYALTGRQEVQPANLVGSSPADLDLQSAQGESGGDA